MVHVSHNPFSHSNGTNRVYDTNMNKLFMPFMMLVYLLLTACDKDDVLPARPMEWSYEIITPANVQFLKSTTDVSPSYFFETNGKGGDMVMTCENYDVLNPHIRRFLRIRLWMGHPQDRRQSGENSLRSIYS